MIADEAFRARPVLLATHDRRLASAERTSQVVLAPGHEPGVWSRCAALYVAKAGGCDTSRKYGTSRRTSSTAGRAPPAGS